MGIFSLTKKIKNKIINFFKKECHCRNKDQVHLNLDGLEIFLERCMAYDKPHEVTIVVPRAELRKKIEKGDELEEIEILLNSITVVSSPQRPSNEGNGEEGPLPEPPEIPRRSLNSKE
ncbi:hypothetical protein [Orenia marismortui]|uniref:Uncharacterized protein n=1 Tax=Orenia marismortui TaxID=46469 RepID=A0A4R8GSZ4_9FIRM|nr:hypothetical protein [Orenia marismortui]TDX49067.1 hypothetical protein C7959_12120 [Orenia marismortui]